MLNAKQKFINWKTGKVLRLESGADKSLLEPDELATAELSSERQLVRGLGTLEQCPGVE